MGFWKTLFGRGKKDAQLNVFAVDTDGDGKVQDGTVWERPAELTLDLDKTLEKAEELLKAVAPAQDLKISEDLEKKRKRSEAAKKAAATRQAKKMQALVDAHNAVAELPPVKKTQPKKK